MGAEQQPDWRYPSYYDVTGTNCLPNVWGYVTDAAHKENARTMKYEVYRQVKELVTQYGTIDELWWGGGWPGQQRAGHRHRTARGHVGIPPQLEAYDRLFAAA
ncbi:hypothetical protein [Streptomyces sp. NPDC002851]